MNIKHNSYVYFIIATWMPDFFFFFNDTATTEIYTLSLHDALPICVGRGNHYGHPAPEVLARLARHGVTVFRTDQRSEEHTSELQSQSNLVCRLLLEKKKTHTIYKYYYNEVSCIQLRILHYQHS